MGTWLVRDARARATVFYVFRAELTHEVSYVALPPPSPFFLLSALAYRLLLCARFSTCRRASAVTRWAPSFRRCFAASTASAATGEYCGDNDAQPGRINVLYHEASGDKYVPRMVFFDLEPSVIDAVRASPIG